jgi:hypothetical protein
LADPKSVELILNRHSVTAIGPHHTDMLDIDLSTDFLLGAVYYEASPASSASQPNGYYTLGPSQPADGRVEFELYDAQGQPAHVRPAMRPCPVRAAMRTKPARGRPERLISPSSSTPMLIVGSGPTVDAAMGHGRGHGDGGGQVHEAASVSFVTRRAASFPAEAVLLE